MKTLQPEQHVCREAGCENLATTQSYCRIHYIKNWQQIQYKKMILQDGSFKKFIQDIANRYPMNVLLAIRNDLSSDEAFERVRNDLSLHSDLGDIAAIDSSDEINEPETFETIKSDGKQR